MGIPYNEIYAILQCFVLAATSIDVMIIIRIQSKETNAPNPLFGYIFNSFGHFFCLTIVIVFER